MESTVISGIDLKAEPLSGKKTGFKFTVTANCENENDILDYHVYLEKNGDIKAVASESNEIEIADLMSDMQYEVYAMVCDIYGNLKKTNKIQVKTPDGPALTIDYAFETYYIDTYGVKDTTEKVNQYLFDGNTDNGGKYKGLTLLKSSSFISGTSYWEFTVSKNIKIYAYGHSYVDSGGSSGQDVIFKKYDGSSYVDYKTCKTDVTGVKYELVQLEPGTYKMEPVGNYVNFDEWEIEVIQ